MTLARSARQVRQAITFRADPPVAWRCRICGEGGSIGQATPCEGACGAWLHWECYWPGMLTPAERSALAAAQQRDRLARRQRVRVKVQGRLYTLPATAIQSALEDFLDHQIVLCPGCRS